MHGWEHLNRKCEGAVNVFIHSRSLESSVTGHAVTRRVHYISCFNCSPIVRPVLVLQLRLTSTFLCDFDMFEGIIIDFVDPRCSVEPHVQELLGQWAYPKHSGR